MPKQLIFYSIATNSLLFPKTLLLKGNLILLLSLDGSYKDYLWTYRWKCFVDILQTQMMILVQTLMIYSRRPWDFQELKKNQLVWFRLRKKVKEQKTLQKSAIKEPVSALHLTVSLYHSLYQTTSPSISQLPLLFRQFVRIIDLWIERLIILLK